MPSCHRYLNWLGSPKPQRPILRSRILGLPPARLFNFPGLLQTTLFCYFNSIGGLLLSHIMALEMALSFLLASCVLLPTPVGATASSTPFNITALSSRDGYSVIECWQLSSVPVEAMSAMNYEIGNTTTATWSIIKPRTTVGEAWAPAVQ